MYLLIAPGQESSAMLLLSVFFLVSALMPEKNRFIVAEMPLLWKTVAFDQQHRNLYYSQMNFGGNSSYFYNDFSKRFGTILIPIFSLANSFACLSYQWAICTQVLVQLKKIVFPYTFSYSLKIFVESGCEISMKGAIQGVNMTK